MTQNKNCTLKFPKHKRKKQHRIHKDSILHKKDGTCYLCRKEGNWRIYGYTEEHHVFGGPLRKMSEAEGLKVYLCPEHHRTGKHAVHKDAAVARILKQEAQRAYEKRNSHDAFMALTGKNYLEDSDVHPV